MPDGWKIDDATGEAKLQRRTIGYYPDKKTAMIALAEYNQNPAALGTANLTFKDIFELWKADHYKNISASSAAGWDNAFKNSVPLHNIKMKDIRTKDLNDCMNGLTVGGGRQRIIKSFWLQLFKYAIEHDIVQKNYAQFVVEKDKVPETTRKPFTDEEVALLWEKVDAVPGADAALIMIYTGMRPSELLQIKAADVDLDTRLMVGGIKTKAGKNRYIPICGKILPLVRRRLADGCETLMSYDGKPMSYARFKYNAWNKMVATLSFKHSPHECRHTGVTIMRRMGIDKDMVKLIVGHSSGDVTDRYTHTKPEQLVTEIDKLDGYPERKEK